MHLHSRFSSSSSNIPITSRFSKQDRVPTRYARSSFSRLSHFPHKSVLYYTIQLQHLRALKNRMYHT